MHFLSFKSLKSTFKFYTLSELIISDWYSGKILWTDISWIKTKIFPISGSKGDGNLLIKSKMHFLQNLI